MMMMMTMADQNNGTTNSKDLEKKLEDARDALSKMNERIIRIVGRPRRPIKDSIRGGEKYTERNNEKSNYEKNNEGGKATTAGVQNHRLSSGQNFVYEEQKPKLNSRIVRELPSRKDIVAVQCADSESHARNRRIFGSLLGTLQKFSLEESRLKQKEDKKALIERKVEKQALLEHETIKREREELFLNRKRKQLEIRQLEMKMNRLQDFEIWRNSLQHLNHTIGTKTLPRIYFAPKIHSKRTQRLLSESQERLSKELKDKRLLLEADFTAMEEFSKKELSNSTQYYREQRNGGNNGDKDTVGSFASHRTSNTSHRLNSTLSSSTSTTLRFKADHRNDDDNCEDGGSPLAPETPIICSTVNIVKHNVEKCID